MRNVGYIGFSDVMIRKLIDSPYFNLVIVFCDKSRITADITKICQDNNILLYLVSNKKELEQFINESEKVSNIELYIVYKSQIILPKTLLEKYDFYNFHCGNLLTNRGAHSLNWSILLGDQISEISVHKIGERIDTGELISSYKVIIDTYERPSTLLEKMEMGIDGLLEQLNRYIIGEIKGTMINDGIYRRKVVSEDFTIDLASDSKEVINKKICSQQDYEGALVIEDDRIFYCTKLLYASNNLTCNSRKVELVGNTLNVYIGDRYLIFEISKVTYK